MGQMTKRRYVISAYGKDHVVFASTADGAKFKVFKELLKEGVFTGASYIDKKMDHVRFYRSARIKSISLIDGSDEN